MLGAYRQPDDQPVAYDSAAETGKEKETTMVDLWDVADAKHKDSKADLCQCGDEARYWLPGDVYVCLACYQAQDVQVEVSVTWLCKECGAEVDGRDGMCLRCESEKKK